MTVPPDPYYAPNSLTYRATELARSAGFYSGLPPVDAKRNVSQIVGTPVFDRSWLERVHLPVLRHLLVPRVPHRLTLATVRGALYASHVNDRELFDDGPTDAVQDLLGFHVTVSHPAAAALYQHFDRHTLRYVPAEVQVPALAAGLTPQEIVATHADETLTVDRARFMFALTEPVPGT